jgi:hypothetical protein
MARLRSCASVVLVLLAMAHPGWAACPRTCASRPEGCGKGFGTVAYVVSTCRVMPGRKMLGTQELRIHRSGCDPITVLRFSNTEPVDDFFGLCAILGQNHQGTSSTVAGVFHRIGVSMDGQAIVFEVTNDFQILVGRLPLAPEEKGFFYIRADGTGLRRLGPASRDPTGRLFEFMGTPSVNVTSRLSFSSDDQRVVFTDLAPGPDGVVTEQLFTMEISTGEQRQVTRFAAAEPPPPGQRIIGSPTFVSPQTVTFDYGVGQERNPLQIDIDGTNLRRPDLPDDPLADGGHVVQQFRHSRRGYRLFQVEFPGPAANEYPVGQPTDLFRSIANRHWVQLTNFRRDDTRAYVNRSKDVLFMASADPVGENPFHACQLFRMSPLGSGLRQVTHFNEGRPSIEGCDITVRPGCGLREVNQFSHAPTLLFYSDCDPFGTNPDGAQIFAIRWNGSRMHQLTHTRGVTRAADGSVLELDIPGPVARGGSR